MNAPRLPTLVFLAVAVTGCRGTIQVTSNPPGATVYRTAGAGPLTGQWHPSKFDKFMLGDAIGPQGQTPVSITRVFTAEMVKVVWPDGVESEVKTTPLSSALALSTPSVAFHFERPTAKVVDLESPRVEAKTGVLAEPPARRSEPILWQAGDRRQVWLLAVGVGQYRDERVPMLPFAAGDTEQVCRWFSGLASQRVSQENIRVLVNEQATRQNLLEQID